MMVAARRDESRSVRTIAVPPDQAKTQGAAVERQKPIQIGHIQVDVTDVGIVFGVGSFAVLMSVWFQPDWSFGTALTRFTGEHWSWSATFGIGLGQVIWIVTEVLMVREASWLQPVCAGVGILIVMLSFEPGFRRYLSRPEN